MSVAVQRTRGRRRGGRKSLDSQLLKYAIPQRFYAYVRILLGSGERV